jgi:hypothetical protein
MAFEDALAALPEHWPDVAGNLGPGKVAELRGYIDLLEGPGRKRAVARISDLIVEGLPRDHPVRRALVAGDLFASAAVDLTAIARTLRDLTAAGPVAKEQTAAEEHAAGGQAAAEPAAEEPPGESATERIVREVTGRLLRAPALSADEVRQRGGDPADPALIWLARADGRQQWPAFQFAPGDGPLAVVREVNQLLEAASYPLGAADWWLSPNGWLGEQPSLLIGTVPDDHLVRAARAIRSEV